jgi:hypothetical protein
MPEKKCDGCGCDEFCCDEIDGGSDTCCECSLLEPEDSCLPCGDRMLEQEDA